MLGFFFVFNVMRWLLGIFSLIRKVVRDQSIGLYCLPTDNSLKFSTNRNKRNRGKTNTLAVIELRPCQGWLLLVAINVQRTFSLNKLGIIPTAAYLFHSVAHTFPEKLLKLT